MAITICDTQLEITNCDLKGFCLPTDDTSPIAPATYPDYSTGTAPYCLHTYAPPYTTPASGCNFFRPPTDHTGADLLWTFNLRIMLLQALNLSLGLQFFGVAFAMRGAIGNCKRQDKKLLQKGWRRGGWILGAFFFQEVIPGSFAFPGF